MWLRPYRVALIISLVLVLPVAALGIVQPRLLGLAIDRYMLQGDLAGLTWVALVFLAVVVLEYVLGAFQVFLITRTGILALGTLRRDIYRHVMAQGQRFFDRKPTGSLLSRTTTDVEAIGESLSTGVVGVFGDVVRLVGILGTMLWLDWRLTLASLSIVPLVVGVVNVIRTRLRDLSVTIRVLSSRLTGFMAEHAAGAEVVQLLDREELTSREFSGINREAVRAFHWSNFWDASLYALMDGISSICIGLVVWYGASRTMDGSLTPGILVAFVEYVQRAMVPVKEFSSKYATMQRSFAALERIYSLLDTHEEIESGSVDPGRIDGPIRFHDVSFGYGGTGGKVLDGVSFEVVPGSVVALVGSTGAGKSTVLRLLTRAYGGYEGSITVGGFELRDLAVEAVRREIAVVYQDVFLFRGTVAFNLGLGAPGTSPERMREAARIVRADQFLDRLPRGYETEVGERGGQLSAGQAQLLAFARALCRDPSVVVLDEATASVDPETEGLIQAAIDRILALKTVLVVAHRLSTIRAADLILVMEGGRIVERGTHATLLAAEGRYAELYRTQLRQTERGEIEGVSERF